MDVTPVKTGVQNSVENTKRLDSGAAEAHLLEFRAEFPFINSEIRNSNSEIIMTIYALIFYILGAVTVSATLLAVTRREIVHAVVYLVISFLGTALLLYLLGAPFLALLEVIIYAGAIMVLFLFTVMMVRTTVPSASEGKRFRQRIAAVIMSLLSLAAVIVLVLGVPAASTPIKAMTASPARFGRFLFQYYWFPVEIASFILLVALVGTLYLGREDTAGKAENAGVKRNKHPFEL